MKISILFRHAFAGVSLIAAAHAGVEIIPTHGRNLYRLAVARTAAAPLIVGSTYDNRVCAFAQDGTHQWDATVDGFVFDLVVGDLDGDGRDEIVTAGADGVVSVFDGAGRKRWTADLSAPVYQVAVARLDGRTPVVLAGGVSHELVAFSAAGVRLRGVDAGGTVRMMRAGDFDGDGADEVALLPIRGPSQDLAFFKGPELAKLPVSLPSSGSQDPAMGSKQSNGIVADLDGDGVPDLIYKPGAYSLKGGLHQVTPLPDRFPEKSYDYNYNMRFVAVGDLTASPGKEIVVLEGPQLRLYDATGRELGQTVAPLGFTDVVYVPGAPYGSVLLGSSPNGDDNFYRLTFAPGWEAALEKIERRGLMAGVGAGLAELARNTAAWRGQPMQGAGGPYDVVITQVDMWEGWNQQLFDGAVAELHADRKRFPYPNVRLGAQWWISEKAPLLKPDGQPWPRDWRLSYSATREEIVAGAQKFEAAGFPFWVLVGHGCGPTMELATAEALLKAAPKTLLGFLTTEDERADEIPGYFEHFVKPLLELNLAHGKRVMIHQKNVWWAQWPADAKMRELIFNGRYRSVILPCIEDSNSRTPDVNLAGRLGLWLDGQVDDWAHRSIADQFSFNRAWEWEYVMTGHPQLRYHLAQTMLGARVFMMKNGEREASIGRWTEKRGEYLPATGNWTRVGTEGTAAFVDLLGKGIITPPRREQLRAVSPVALAMRPPAKRFALHGPNGHKLWNWNVDGTDTKPWAFDRLDSYWGMAPLPPTDVSTYLWGRTRRDASQLPVTAPQGFVAILPGFTPRADSRWSTVWTSDGDTLEKGGRTYALAEAREAMLADLAAGEQSLPFHVEGRVFHQVVEQSPDSYIIALVDPGWVDPAERAVKLATRLPGSWQVTDRLTGRVVGTLAQPLELTVPAGLFRLLEVRRN